MVLSGEPFAASGSYDPYRPALRAGAAAAEQLPFRGLASHCPTGRGARSANGGFSRSLLYRVNLPATIISSAGISSAGISSDRLFIDPAILSRGWPCLPGRTRSLKHAWNGIANSAYEGPAARAHGMTVV